MLNAPPADLPPSHHGVQGLISKRDFAIDQGAAGVSIDKWDMGRREKTASILPYWPSCKSCTAPAGSARTRPEGARIVRASLFVRAIPFCVPLAPTLNHLVA